MANYTEAQWNAKKAELMETCFTGFAELGLHGTGIRTLAKHCGYNTSMIYTYFKDLDDLIIQSTEYCMSKVEQEFMAKAPTDVENLVRELYVLYGGILSFSRVTFNPPLHLTLTNNKQNVI